MWCYHSCITVRLLLLESRVPDVFCVIPIGELGPQAQGVSMTETQVTCAVWTARWCHYCRTAGLQLWGWLEQRIHKYINRKTSNTLEQMSPTWHVKFKWIISHINVTFDNRWVVGLVPFKVNWKTWLLSTEEENKTEIELKNRAWGGVGEF